MHTHRKIILILCIVLVLGPLSVTVGYAIYLRSDAYKHSIENDVTDFLNLTTRIERVEPLSRNTRRFHDIRVLLEDGRTEVFKCDRALWRQAANGQRVENVLEIQDGALHLNADYNAADYDTLRRSVTHDYRELALANILLANIDVTWRQPDIEFRIGATNGDVQFTDDGLGRATLLTHLLNDFQSEQPIRIEATLATGENLVVRRLAVHAPPIPLAALGLSSLVGANVTDGWFEGRLTLDQNAARRKCRVRGALGDARLEQFTGILATGRLHGRVNITVDDAVFDDRQLVRLIFGGELTGIQLSDLAPLFDQPDLDGTVDVRVEQARYENGGIAHLSAAADAREVSLTALTKLIGRGVITGQLRVTVDSVVVADDRIRWADIRLDALAPPNGKGTIERRLILDAAKEALKVDLGRVGKLLPEKVGYQRLGCRLVIDGSELRVMGTHGKDNRTILTVRVLGRDIGIIKAPDRTYRIRDVIAEIRSLLANYDAGGLLDWLQEKGGPLNSNEKQDPQ